MLEARAGLGLVRPAAEHLPSHIAALQQDWSADTQRGAVAAREDLARAQADPQAYLASMDDREAKGPPVTLPDGSQVPRIPGYRRWLWDGEFCGSVNFRWLPGSTDLPPHVMGHIGYAVVPWKQGRGYATRALTLLLQELRAEEGLPFVTVTTDADNFASQKVITANGGELVEHFNKPPLYGGKPSLRYRIMITRPG
jgi:predicted acetyltransferase